MKSASTERMDAWQVLLALAAVLGAGLALSDSHERTPTPARREAPAAVAPVTGAEIFTKQLKTLPAAPEFLINLNVSTISISSLDGTGLGYRLGLRQNDKILQVGNQTKPSFDQFFAYHHLLSRTLLYDSAPPEAAYSYTVERAGKKIELQGFIRMWDQAGVDRVKRSHPRAPIRVGDYYVSPVTK